MTIDGIDIASHQGPDFDFAQAADAGCAFVIIKASGGHTYRNEYLAEQVAGARAAGMMTSFYHYQFEPSYGTPQNPSGGDVAREAANFIEACRPHVQAGSTFWLDVEEFPKSVGFTGDLGGWIVDFCERVGREFGCVCGIYCATWYLVPTGLDKDQRLTKYPFWMASWQDTPPLPRFMAPWDHLTLWQYNADVIDKDRFFGTVEEFMALGVPGAGTGGEVWEPEAGEVAHYLNDDGELIAVINFGGEATEILGVNYADIGGSVRNAAGAEYDRSLKGGVFGEWVKRPLVDQGG